MAAKGPKSSLALFRDCLRLIGHMAGRDSPKAVQLRAIVAAQFRAHRHEADPARVHVLKQGCVAEEARRARTRGGQYGVPLALSPALLPARPSSRSAEKGLSNYLIYHTAKTCVGGSALCASGVKRHLYLWVTITHAS